MVFHFSVVLLPYLQTNKQKAMADAYNPTATFSQGNSFKGKATKLNLRTIKDHVEISSY